MEPAKPYFLANLASATKRKIILIRPLSYPLSPFKDQTKFFLSQLSLRLDISSLPPLSENPYQEIWPSLESISSRMSFFYKLLKEPPSLIITNLLGLLKPFPCRQDLKGFFLVLSKGTLLDRDQLLRKLAEYGYAQQDLVNSAGEFAWRGGIVDVFSPWEEFPFRIEFSGEEIFSLRQFHPTSQRSIRKIDRICLSSLREFSTSSEFINEWQSLVQKKAEASAFNDLLKKINKINKRKFFPSFFFLSLVHNQHFVSFENYLKDPLLIVDDYEQLEKEWKDVLKDLKEQHKELKQQGIYQLSPEEIFPEAAWSRIRKEAIFWQELRLPSENKSFFFSFQSGPKFKNKIPAFIDYLKRLIEAEERCFIYLSSPSVRHRLAALLNQYQIPYVSSNSPLTPSLGEGVVLLIGPLKRGFSYPALKINYFAESDIFTEEKVLVARPRIKPFVPHFQDLKAGDYVVHVDYGIGVFQGLVKLKVDGQNREFMAILYKDEDKLFVPVENLNLVQKFSKSGPTPPFLHKLGSPTWKRTKARTKKAIENMARELLQLYAQRKAAKGYKFSPGGTWLEEFERIFEYEETDDQLRAVKEVMKDMESPFPMDRLLCGDVGYGKTEVAMRASFKAVMDGKQVAVLCPTTVLVSQHLKTFRNRMILFPVRVEALSRLQTKKQQKKIIEDLAKGLIDIIIGTHRLLSEDVKFRDLGLLIVDEEQRFGVSHKEKIKKLKTNVDVLTMSATPIPRTLNLSLTGLRDISLIETPPKDRLSIHTVVAPFSPKLISQAIKMELARRGQVYYIHNRIEDIDTVAAMIKRLIPQARVAVIHGQMSSITLERRMIDFISRKYNVLVSTTIIENGIDIPLVNTLIVERADLFGLAQLYQLRGRVGRSSRQAVAYFLVPPLIDLTSLAKERLKALQEFSELGSGFRLAAKDLEIRGAGSFLGFKQHGYLEAVGFDYYLNLLEKTVKELKGEKFEEFKSEINLR
ncbi:MAG: transcription-repair coupling factor, partial [Candidatus Aminicenantales bacterium]